MQSFLKWFAIVAALVVVLFLAAIYLGAFSSTDTANQAASVEANATFDANAVENASASINISDPADGSSAAPNASDTYANTADTNAASTSPMRGRVGSPAPTKGLWDSIGLPDLGAFLPGSVENEAEEGVGRFADPGPMVLGNWYPLKFVAAPDVRATLLEIPDANLTAAQPVYLSPTMRVTLLPDPNFETTPATDAVQNTGKDLTQTWQWNVKPLHDGTQSLTARVEAGELRKDGSFDAKESRTRTVTIRVKVGTWDGFVRALGRASNLGDVLATLLASWEKTLKALAGLIGAVGLVWAAIRKLKGKPVLPRRLRRKKAA